MLVEHGLTLISTVNLECLCFSMHKRSVLVRMIRSNLGTHDGDSVAAHLKGNVCKRLPAEVSL